MLTRSSFLSSRSFKIALGLIIIAFVLARVGFKQHYLKPQTNSVLQGNIHIEPLSPLPNETKVKVQPGTAVKISLTIENKGEQTTPAGDVFIKYAFPSPLENEPTSVLYQTEKVSLPAIAPQKSTTITFAKPHQWPSLIDFIRYDWAMREYQAVFVTGGQQNVIGTQAITYSAYYYPGIRKEFTVSLE